MSIRWLLHLGSLCLLALPVLSWAALSNTPVFLQQHVVALTSFVQGPDAAGTYKTLYTPSGTEGAKCYSLRMSTTDDTATHLVTLEFERAGTRYGGTSITTALNAGYDPDVPPQNVLIPAVWPGLASDSDGNRYFYIASGDTLRATFATPLTTGKVINLQLTCVEFADASGAAGTSLTVTEVDGSPTGTFSTLKFSNGSVANNGDGSATITTGSGGGGDFSSNTSASVDGEAVLFSGAGGKTGRRATLNASVVKSTAGVLGAAVPGIDYQNPLPFTPENVANKSTITALGTSNILFPTQAAVKTYVDTAVAAGVGTPAPGGSAGQAQYHGGAALAGSSGLTLNATSVLTRRDAVTAVSADTTLEAHNIVLVTTGTGAVMLTLPSAAAPTVGQYVVVKADATLGELRVLPAGADLLNTRNGFISTDVPLTGFRLTWLSASAGWLAEPLNIPLRAEDLANGVSGTGFVVLQTSPVLLGGDILEMALTLNGHLEMRANLAPTVASGAADCGTAPVIAGNDMQGRVTVGTTPAGKCTLTFAAAWSQAPSCFCQNATAAQLCRGLNATTTTVELTGTLVAGNVLEFRCGANY